MRKSHFIIIFILALLMSCSESKKSSNTNINQEQVGLMIIDAQKWYIPGHPESAYEIWGYGGSDTIDHKVIPAMDSVLKWANSKQLPVFVTYEAQDTGRHDLPNELLKNLDSNRTTHYVKFYFGATKHDDFQNLIQQSQIDHWIIIGAETDVCVYQTVKGLLKQNKKVTLVNEAIYSGRNITSISRQNLSSFGAHFIDIEQLYTNKNLFIDVEPNVEQSISFDNTTLTIFHSNDTTTNNGDMKRLKYLVDYAKVIGLKIEHPDSLVTSNKSRLIAGDITLDKLNKIKENTDDELIIISDCTPFLQDSELSDEWRLNTLKIVFYELLETAAFYDKSIDELEGWKKELKKAWLDEKLGYVESLQNE